MHVFLLSLFGVMVAMSVATPAPATLQAELQKLQQIADERARLVSELLPQPQVDDVAVGDASEAEEVASTVTPPRKRGTGLQSGRLGPATLQPAAGLQSGAVGLTPEAEWRRMFPHKPGYSR